jgi:uncharacterized protein (TIGR02466 family)
MIEFVNKEVVSLFPSLLFYSKIENKQLLKGIVQNVMDLKKKGHGNGSHTGWWSLDDIHQLPEFEELAESLLKEADNVLDFFKVKREGCYLTSMWANIANRPEYSHQNHIHPNSLLSGVLHVNLPEGASGTTFGDPRPGARIFEPTHTELNQFNAGTFNPPGEDGTLFIFPSYLPHGVHPSEKVFPKDKKRITISFNVMIVGRIETRTAPLDLK